VRHIKTIDDMHALVAAFRTERGGRVGLVPTMGAFHPGHVSLMRAARLNCDLLVVSLFVNPAQFGPAEDLESYPCDLESDLNVAAAEGVDAVFAPEAAEIYPPGHCTYIDIGELGELLCGRNRPGHFRGVATVVAKLFNITQPDAAWFGQKDAQQVAVIKKMVRDLNFPVEILVAPIVREDDGLAMSSRNRYLTEEERPQATILYRAMQAAAGKAAAGETNVSKLRRLMRKTIGANYLVELEYARIVDPDTMESVQEIDGRALAVVAATIGRARLIDNMMIGPEAAVGGLDAAESSARPSATTASPKKD
jgi:pantoate--beta-alanine ligase